MKMKILLEPTSNKLMVVGEIVTHWFTLIALSTLRCSDNKNMLSLMNLSILTDLQATPTKPGRMTKPYSSHRFIANYFNAGNLKMEVKEEKKPALALDDLCLLQQDLSLSLMGVDDNNESDDDLMDEVSNNYNRGLHRNTKLEEETNDEEISETVFDHDQCDSKNDGVVDGEVVIMGDFNKVRSQDERFGSTFNVQGTANFNSFNSLGVLVPILGSTS
nr:hypothetical protein [Tanacetum cinerariifolium]